MHVGSQSAKAPRVSCVTSSYQREIQSRFYEVLQHIVIKQRAQSKQCHRACREWSTTSRLFQANSAFYPQRNGKWVPAKVRGGSRVRYGSSHLWINVWVADKTVHHSLTRTIPERLRGQLHVIKRYTKKVLYFISFSDFVAADKLQLLYTYCVVYQLKWRKHSNHCVYNITRQKHVLF